MKRIVILLTALMLFSSLYGCGQAAEPELIMPTKFYYHNNLDAKEDFDNVFVAEVHEGILYQDDPVALLNGYLSGPISENLINPFPSGLKIISLEIIEETAYIVLSDQIAKLNGIDLTMACSCLSLTLFDVAQCSYVQISSENTLISDKKAIVIAKDTLLLSDDTRLITEG